MDKWIGKIEALLAKAEGTDSEQEAQVFYAKASELIVKYGIEQSQIDAVRASKGEPRGQIVRQAMWFGGVYAMGTMLGAYQVIQEVSGGAIFCMKSASKVRDYLKVSADDNGVPDSRQGYYLYLHGYESDIDQARLLVTSISIQANRAMHRWWSEKDPVERIWDKQYGVSDNMRKRSYIQGFFEGAADKIKQARREVVQQASTGAQVALVDRKQQVHLWMDQKGIGTGRAGRPTYSDYGARSAGTSQGRRADVGQPRFATTKAVGR